MPAVSTTYDNLVYTTRPRTATHPDTLATMARLNGLQPAPITQCRVLELGCGTGGNLTPMAATLPDSEFVGVDYSAVQIELARQDAEQVGVRNITFRAESILDLDESLGDFDYIIAHGVFSWVPEPVRARLLAYCGERLTPHGIAYMSYNTYPGWYRRAAARDAIRWHGLRASTPQDQTRSGRAFLNFLAKNVVDPDEPYAKLLRDEAQLLADERDYYLYHEHLEADHFPLYFRDFMERATTARLQYLGEVPPFRLLVGMPPDVQQTVRAMSPDRIHLEQYVDFLRNRSFRRTLLVRADAPLVGSPDPAILLDLLVGAGVRPVSATPNGESNEPEEFVSEEGTTATTDDPITKTALIEIFREWPRCLPVPELRDRVAAILGARWSSDPERSWRELAQLLLEGHLNHLVVLQTHQATMTKTPGERPLGFSVPRLRTGTTPNLVTLRHQEVPVPPFEQAVFRLLDGTRDRATVTALLATALMEGQLSLPEGDQSLAERTELAIQQLAAAALIVS